MDPLDDCLVWPSGPSERINSCANVSLLIPLENCPISISVLLLLLQRQIQCSSASFYSSTSPSLVTPIFKKALIETRRFNFRGLGRYFTILPKTASHGSVASLSVKDNAQVGAFNSRRHRLLLRHAGDSPPPPPPPCVSTTNLFSLARSSK